MPTASLGYGQAGSRMIDAGTHIIRVTLQDEPTIFREIEVESRNTPQRSG
jgi:hypothetical protein